MEGRALAAEYGDPFINWYLIISLIVITMVTIVHYVGTSTNVVRDNPWKQLCNVPRLPLQAWMLQAAAISLWGT